MSEANALRFSVGKESSYGTPPADAYITEVRGQSLTDNLGYQQSQLLTATPDVRDLARTSRSATGSVPSELMFDTAGGQYLLMLAAMRSTPTAATTQVTAVTSTSGVLSGGSGNVETGCEVGDVVRIRDNSDVLLGYFRVGSINTGTHTMTVEGTLPDGANRKVYRGLRAKNGSNRDSFSVEVAKTDVSKFQMFSGMGVGGMSLRVEDGALAIPLEFQFSGQTSETDTSDIFSGTYNAAPTTPIMDVLSVQQITIGTATTYEYKSLQFAINNNLRARTAVGSANVLSLGWGSYEMTGTLSAYFDSYDEVEKFKDNTATSLLFVLTDSLGNAMSFSFPQVKYTSASAATQGLNTDDILTMGFQAYKDPIELITSRVQWFPA